jgi:ribosomal protein S6--L-glutamate ligase
MENNFVGWEEWVSLPQLNLPALLAKTDTGAETSALHAFNIQAFGKENNQMVRFGINPIDTDDSFQYFAQQKLLIKEMSHHQMEFQSLDMS